MLVHHHHLGIRLFNYHRIYSVFISPLTMSKSTPPNPLPNHVYKILPNTSIYQGCPIPVPSSWEFPQTEVDARDGYVHLSTSEQLPGTLSRFYGSDDTVQLIKVDYKRLSSFKIVKWEQASSGGVYPHLYAILEGGYVIGLKVVARGNSWDDTTKDLREKGWLED